MLRITPLLLTTTFAAAATMACGPRYAKHEPVPITFNACCIEASEDLLTARGCRYGTDRCRGNERIWMRGNIECGPVDPARCLGGRCCEYHEEDKKEEETKPPCPEPEETPESEPEPEPNPDPEPEPEPEPASDPEGAA